MDAPEPVRICPRCGSDNRCGFGQSTPCWCATRFEPGAPPDPEIQTCLCARCLKELREERRGAKSAT
jgi:hypothetical protein